MKHVLSRIVPWLLPACVVDTPVVHGEDDRLGAGLQAWCASACDRFIGCGAPDDPATCPADCAKLFNDTFVGNGEVCSGGALRIMDCIEAAPCSETSFRSACDVENEADLCAISQGQVVCHGEDYGTGGAGAAAGSAGYAGVAGFLCEVEISACSDTSVYRLACSSSDDLPLCRCSTDDSVTKTFEPESFDCPFSDEAVEICGWPITRIRDLSGSEGTICSAYEGIGPGAPGSECSVAFDDCMNGHHYRLECSGVPGSASCTCLIDGIDVGSYADAEGVCPYISSNSDSGVLAVYDACGFEISFL